VQFAAEKAIYDLAKEFKYDEVITAINEMEKKGELSFAMAMQRIYAYSNQKKYAQALGWLTRSRSKNRRPWTS